MSLFLNPETTTSRMHVHWLKITWHWKWHIFQRFPILNKSHISYSVYINVHIIILLYLMKKTNIIDTGNNIGFTWTLTNAGKWCFDICQIPKRFSLLLFRNTEIGYFFKTIFFLGRITISVASIVRSKGKWIHTCI